MRNNFIKRALIVSATLLTLNPVLASQYKNSILNLKLNKDNISGIKINVVTSKLYSSPLNVIQKGENKYIVLLPETENLTRMSPVIDNYSDLIKSISISTIPYSNSGIKGYTKITITTQKPINISATSSLPISTNNEVKKSTQQQTKKTEQDTKKYVTNVKNIQNKKVEKNNNKIVENKQINKVIENKTIVNNEIKPKEQKTSNELLPPEPDILIKHKELLEEEIKNEEKDKQKNINENNSLVKVFIEKLGLRNFLLLLSAIGFPLIMILLIIIMNKKLKQKMGVIKSTEQENIKDEQVLDNISQEQHKMQNELQIEEFIPQDINDFNEEEFIPDVNQNTNIKEINNQCDYFGTGIDESNKNDLVEDEPIETFAEVLEKEEPIEYYESPINIEAITYNQQKPKETLSEPENELTANELKNEENIEFYSEDININELDEVISNSEEDFKERTLDEELLEQKEEQVEEVIEECYEPDGFINLYENNNINLNEMLVSKEAYENDLLLEQKIGNNDIDDDSIIEEISKDENDDAIFNELIIEKEDVNSNIQSEDFENNELQLLNQVNISENKGFYLVEDDNNISLIGYINEEVFVLKSFNKGIKNNINYRLAEQISEYSSRYFLRIDKFKMIVEVSDSKIEHIIDL